MISRSRARRLVDKEEPEDEEDDDEVREVRRREAIALLALAAARVEARTRVERAPVEGTTVTARVLDVGRADRVGNRAERAPVLQLERVAIASPVGCITTAAHSFWSVFTEHGFLKTQSFPITRTVGEQLS